jgi:hypothetical protein
LARHAAAASAEEQKKGLNPSAKPFKPKPKSGKPRASTWTPALAAERAAQAAAEASEPRALKDSAAAKAAAKAAAQAAEKAKVEQKLNELRTEAEELRKERLKAEVDKRRQQEEAAKQRHEEESQAREAAASLASAMEGSGVCACVGPVPVCNALPALLRPAAAASAYRAFDEPEPQCVSALDNVHADLQALVQHPQSAVIELAPVVQRS